jgi:hypothetical protein
MLGTFGILNLGIGICLGFRLWNFVFEAELCSGGVYPRLTLCPAASVIGPGSIRAEANRNKGTKKSKKSRKKVPIGKKSQVRYIPIGVLVV